MAQTTPEDALGASLPSASGDAQATFPAHRFHVQAAWIDDILHLVVRGDVDVLTAPVLIEAFDRAMAEAPAAVIVDLSDVTFLASAGMTALVAAQEKMGASTRLAVVADGPTTTRPLTLIGLDSVLKLFPSLEEACSALR
jgi:anti-sigma B factor antagonist